MESRQILEAKEKIEFQPEYAFIAAQYLLDQIQSAIPEFQSYESYLPLYIKRGVDANLLDPQLQDYDLATLAKALRPERDLRFNYQGLKTLYDRYLMRDKGSVIELPQLLWMRVAMALAMNEESREAKAIEFYHLFSQLLFVPATPTLFNAGTLTQQLSSCFLTTVQDNLEGIFDAIHDNAMLSKWAGGLGNDWTNIRGAGKEIKGTHGNSLGVIPFLKIVNDTAVAVNQGGKRQGAVCVYLENWHLDIEDFLDLCKNTGDERRRCHDLHTACWISDEFMRRVEACEDWTLFSPDDVPDLHDLYGQAFSQRYREYEQLADQGEIQLFKRLPANTLWRKMLTRLFQTGHPWVTFKDPSNIRNPQDHAGVVHSSNLCTEILLNTSETETAVCNLGSLNLSAHIRDGKMDYILLQTTITTAIRMLDNVIDINYYPTPEAKNANTKHRPIGLGIMGFQDALYKTGLSYASEEAVNFADKSMESIAFYATLASSDLAAERGAYPSYVGSKWDRDILPLDSLYDLERERDEEIEVYRSTTYPWHIVRQKIAAQGMRNSNILAIAPTATISLIAGCSQSIEPTYMNLYAKANLSGDFTAINTFLIADLKELGLWDRDMLEALKYYDGSIQEIPIIPEVIRDRYRTAFEIDPSWLIKCAAARQKWIDQGQSLNLYMRASNGNKSNGRKLSDMYFSAWHAGLKTTYYLRSKAATQIEKSTVNINKFGIQPRWMEHKSASADVICTADVCEVCQ